MKKLLFLALILVLVISCGDDDNNQNQENRVPILNNQAFTVPDNIDSSVLIGQIIATDPDNDDLTFFVDIDYDLKFDLSSSGELRLRQNESLNYDTSTSHQIDIYVSDGQENSPIRTITVNLELPLN